MATRFRFKDFKVYQKAKIYYKDCRDIVRKQIRGKDPELAGQIDRALNSLVLNVAQGSANDSDAEFGRYPGISMRSVYETVAGFDLALLNARISAEQNEAIPNRGL
jgi:four helix bundle protein